MPAISRWAKIGFSWAVALLGMLVGLFSLGLAANTDLRRISILDEYWLKDVSLFIGLLLVGIVLLSASLAALRNRRRAARIYFRAAPVLAFCLAFSGADSFELPFVWSALWLSALFYLPILLFFLPIRSRKLSWLLSFSAAAVAVAIFLRSPWTLPFIPILAVVFVSLSALGWFWIKTEKREWPQLLEPRSESLLRGIARTPAVCAVIAPLLVMLSLAFVSLRSSIYGPGGCYREPPRLFSRPFSPDHTVFTARVIFAAPSLSTRLYLYQHQEPPLPADTGDWAIASVQDQYWGLPAWWPRWVLLTGFPYVESEVYFVDGYRTFGVLPHALPIVVGGPGCVRTSPLSEAGASLRALRTSHESGGRILGRVTKRSYEASKMWNWPKTTLMPGVQVELQGPTGIQVATTDESGVYEFYGLAAGDYSAHISLPDTEAVERRDARDKVRLEADGLLDESFEVLWNGTIEGHVRDELGGPVARVRLELRKADGSEPAPYVGSVLRPDADGSYRMTKIPPGRYVVVVNPYGPTGDSDLGPYDTQYYPASPNLQGARIFQLSEGQHIAGIDFVLPHLPERTIHVNVRWPDGRPERYATVCAVYEPPAPGHGSDCDSSTGVGEDGGATLHLYRDGPVRLFARGLASNPKTHVSEDYYSSSWESGLRSLPAQLDFVLTTVKPTPHL